MASSSKTTGKKKESLFDSIVSPFNWVAREAMLPDTLLRLARARKRKK